MKSGQERVTLHSSVSCVTLKIQRSFKSDATREKNRNFNYFHFLLLVLINILFIMIILINVGDNFHFSWRNQMYSCQWSNLKLSPTFKSNQSIGQRTYSSYTYCNEIRKEICINYHDYNGRHSPAVSRSGHLHQCITHGKILKIFWSVFPSNSVIHAEEVDGKNDTMIKIIMSVFLTFKFNL